MTLEALRCFCAVIEAGSFRGAATRIHRSQPAVSQQIKSLETQLGRSLVDRGSCAPTPAGAVLYGRARRILNEADSIDREIREFDDTYAAPLRIGTSDTTALYFLPERVREFAAAMPGVRMEIVNRPSAVIADYVLRGDLDLGIVTLPIANEALETRVLFNEQLVLVVRDDHPLADRERIDLPDLAAVPLLLLDGSTRTGAMLRDHFAVSGFSPAVALDSGSFEVIKRYVAEGTGIGFLPEMVVQPGDARLRIVRVDGLPEVVIGAVWRRGAYQSSAERTFLGLIAQS